MLTHSTSGSLAPHSTHRAHTVPSVIALARPARGPVVPGVCGGSHSTSPYTLVESFLTQLVDSSSDERHATSGRDALSRMLEFAVSEADYRMLVAPLLYTVAEEGRRPSGDEISEHGRRWLNELP